MRIMFQLEMIKNKVHVTLAAIIRLLEVAIMTHYKTYKST
jgi:hypothetical protein